MNTNKLKSYAPKARIAFMQAVMKRAAVLGLYEDRIADVNIQGDNAIIEGRVFTRKQGQQRNQLVKRIESLGTHDGKLDLKAGFKQFINETAFTWFNRFTAIRYMEINGYLDHGFRVLSKPPHSDGSFAKFDEGFEILSHAADVADDLGLDKAQMVQMMLDGDKEEDLYREILLGQCHQLSNIMAFMFEKLDDATELLIPDNLTKTDSILKALIDDLPEDNWRDIEGEKGQIEVIGWLYQFYISEHKDAVIGKVVKREDIPAATQLFTPNWIVKYLVQNSLGRQWLATYPDSALKDKMEYYITPAQQSDDVIAQLKAITPTSIDPEQIKVLDPACGSGHILVEVYEVLREIYLENGYRLREIPEIILTKNIYGLDIDDRAAQMAAFAVLMKAREDDKRIFSRISDSVGTEHEIKLNIYSLQPTENLNINKLWADLDFDGKQQTGGITDLFAEPQQDVAETSATSAENKVYLNLLRYLKTQFTDAKNLGSLIEVDSQYQVTLAELKGNLLEKAQNNHQPTRQAVEVLLPIVEQAIVLANKYDVAVANPPYMGAKGMNAALKDLAKKSYPNSKSDLFAIFMERVFNFLKEEGYNAQVNMQSWMFLSSFEKMRESLLDTKTFITMAHLGARAFGQISGEVVQTTAWVLNKKHVDGFQPSFLRLVDGKEEDKKQALLLRNNLFCHNKQADFQKIPASPIAYWVSKATLSAFNLEPIGKHATLREGIHTGYNDGFVRHWAEINSSDISFDSQNQDDFDQTGKVYAPYNKGGSFRKWYGNNEQVIMWDPQNRTAMSKLKGHVRPSQNLYFLPSIEWSLISSGRFGARVSLQGSLNDVASHYLCSDSDNVNESAMALFNSKLGQYFLSLLNPTLNFSSGVVTRLPFIKITDDNVSKNIKDAINIVKLDWDMFENSYEFDFSYWLDGQHKIKQTIRSVTEKQTSDLENLIVIETKINTYLVEKFGLENAIDPVVNVEDITLTSNPYTLTSSSSDKAAAIFRVNLLIKQLIGLFIGLSMGRYSLDRDGLVYAHSGNNGFKELVAEDAYKTFPADDDGIIPLAAEEWLFDDDATTRFREFVKTVWGKEHLTENLDFVAESLCLDAIKPLSTKKSGGESAMDTIRRYFSTQFYKDHLKTYKKRPIYWLFSSGKEKAFECLVYLHRYNESTLARMRTEYVTPLMGKMESQLAMLVEKISDEASTSEKTRLGKELKSLEKKQAELRAFDEELKHLAEMKISLDLDDGVKVNYGKFGNLLADVKDIHGKKPEAVK